MTDAIAQAWEHALTIFENHEVVAGQVQALSEEFFVHFPKLRTKVAECFIFSLALERVLSAGAQLQHNRKTQNHDDSNTRSTSGIAAPITDAGTPAGVLPSRI
jgi:hypothetical protein